MSDIRTILKDATACAVVTINALEQKNATLRRVLRKIKERGCNGGASYDALDCKSGKIAKGSWCESCMADDALKDTDD